MTPSLASLLCAAFVFWLFWQESKRRKVSSALWLPLIWIFIIGSKPISLWFGYGSAFGGEENYVEGSPFDRFFFMALIGAAWIVLLKRQINWGEWFRTNRWLFIYFLYLGLSVVWSDYSFVSFKRWIKDFGNVLMVLVVFTEENPLEALKSLLSRAAFLLIPLSMVLVKYYPQIGRYYDSWTYQPHYAGVSTDKNLFGMSLFFCELSLVWMLVELRTRRGKEFGICALLLLMNLWLLTKAQSSTALSCGVLGSGIVISLIFPGVRNKVGRLGLYCGLIAVAALALNAVVDLGGIFVQVVGRDLTFTGRTDIWSALLKEPVNPLLGEGFYSFWMGDRVQRLSEKYFYQLNEAHDGYLETYLNNGLLGVALLLILLATSFSRIQRQTAAGSVFGPLRIAFLISGIIYNITEASFDRLSLLWFALLLVICEPPTRLDAPELQASLEQPEEPAPVPTA